MRALLLMTISALSFLAPVQTPLASQAIPSVAGTSWSLTVTVPGSPPADNVVTFSKGDGRGTFVDRNDHRGTWEQHERTVTWRYTSVPDLTNVFTGRLSDDGRRMEGSNSGVWQSKEFVGQWTGVRRSN